MAYSNKGKAFLLLLLLIFSACSNLSQDNQFTLLSPDDSGFLFDNRIVETDSVNAFSFLYAYNGSGVGIGDLNNDGLQDIVMGGNMIESKVFINDGEMQFHPLSKNSGFFSDRWVHGVSLVDINADGLLDIYLSNGGLEPSNTTENQLFLNLGDLTFKEVGSEYGLNIQSLSTHTVFFDFDKDNDLDAYVLNYENNVNKDPNIIKPKSFKGNSLSQDRLLVNENGRFKDVSKYAGINQEGYGLGIHVTDFNNDGWSDIYVSNDFAYDDLLYLNQQDGTFEESLSQYFKHTSNFGMGIDMADINNDGENDLYQVDMLPEDNRRQKKLLSGMNYDRHQMLISRGYTPQYMRNSLQLNTGMQSFQEIGNVAGVSNTDWSWSPLIADLDNDGWKDLYITNGYVKDVTDVDFRDYVINETRKRNATFDEGVVIQALEDLKGEKTANYNFRNIDGTTFDNITEESGMQIPSFSTGSAYGDLDNDGDLDLVVNNLNDPSFLFKNNTDDENNYFQIKLKDGDLSLQDIGSKVSIYYQTQTQSSEWNPYRGFQSTSEQIIHFGLGSITEIDSVIIHWTDQTYTKLKEVPANTRITVDLKKVNKEGILRDFENQKLFEDQSSSLAFNYTHEESPYVDFKSEALIPHKLSTNGPVSVVSDINGDGLDDVFIGSAMGEPNVLMIQTQNIEGPKFIKEELTFGVDSEATSAAFFDFDKDNDLDLYIVNGSNEMTSENPLYKDILLINNGEGEFSDASEKLPELYYSGGAVAPFDFDDDGDIDLFVGGALQPKNYPLPGVSQFLINEDGVFKNRIHEISTELEEIGMIKAARWGDVTGDGQLDLVLTGEFMPIMVFEVKGQKLVKSQSITGFEGLVGWWNDIQLIDIDNDGDQDVIAANLGLNSRYKASLDYPLNVYAKDFDSNGTLDAILTYYNNGKEYPIPDRALITQQIPPIKKKFTSNIKYAESTIDEVFPKSILESAYQLNATHFGTSIFENTGGGKFVSKELPHNVQYSRVNTILTWDIDGDGLKDLVLGGNSNATDVFTGNYDAQTSLILRNLGGFKFESISTFGTGFPDNGVITDLQLLSVGNSQMILSLRNNENAILSKLTKINLESQSGR